MYSVTSQSLSLLCCKLANTTCHSLLVTGLLLFNCWCNPSFSFTTSWTRILKVFISSWNETHGNRHPHEHIQYRLGCCCLGKSNVTAIAMAESCSSSKFGLQVLEPLRGLRSTAYCENSQVTDTQGRTWVLRGRPLTWCHFAVTDKQLETLKEGLRRKTKQKKNKTTRDWKVFFV